MGVVSVSMSVDNVETEDAVDPSVAVVGAVAGGDSAAVVSDPADDVVDETGEDLTKPDELPSGRDAVAVATDERSGIEYSNMVCPLIASGDQVKSQREFVTQNKVEITTRQPQQVLVRPVECPTCHIKVESHQLVFDKAAGGGVRDCAMAIQNREHPTTKELIAAHDAGDTDRVQRIAQRHPLGERILEILGLRKHVEETETV